MKDESFDYRERWRERARQMFDSSEARKAFENVLDHETGMSLIKLQEREVIDTIYGVIEAGKESVIFLADTPDDEIVVLKIYMYRAGGFREMASYLRGDKRFRNIKSDRRSVVHEWCKKEFKNLKKASQVVKCPEAIAFQKNVLVMEFIGKEFSPYPKLKEVEIENPEEALENILDGIKRLWEEEKLVHGDLSEYNMLVEEDRPVWIDFSQGVHVTHPEAGNLLERDIENIVNFFNKQGANTDSEKAFKRVLES